jgi:micrococcal nuclease
LDLFIDLGFCNWSKQRVRLFGLDTPETYGVKKESEEYAKGKAATAYVSEWLDQHAPDGLLSEANWGPVLITSHDGKDFGQGKYGRWIVIVHSMRGESLNRALLESGHATAIEY